MGLGEVLICVDWQLPFADMPGAKAGHCHKCKRSIVISPQGQKLMERQPSVEPICQKCMSQVPDEDDGELTMTPEIAEEIERVAGVDPRALIGLSAKKTSKYLQEKEERKRHS